MSFIRFVSFNINSDRRLEWKHDPRFKHTANAFYDLSIKQRFPVIKEFILQLIKHKNIPCFALQEIDEEALKHLEHLFKELNFKIYVAKYCPHKDSYHYLLAVDERRIKVKEIKSIYFTETGAPTSNEDREKLTKEQKLEKHYDQEFEKSAQLVVVSVEENNKHNDFVLVNVQAGTSNKHRLLAMSKLSKTLQDYKLPIFIAGDFNQFNAEEKKPEIYDEQVKLLQKNGFQWCTEEMQKTGLKSTFFAFPHDIEWRLLPDQKKELEGLKQKEDYQAIRNFYIKMIEKNEINLASVCLDAVYAKNHENFKLKTRPLTMLNGKIINTAKQDPKDFQQKFLAFFKKQNPQMLEMPASDHFALLTKIEFGK